VKAVSQPAFAVALAERIAWIAARDRRRLHRQVPVAGRLRRRAG
jgi:hypothetical protein